MVDTVERRAGSLEVFFRHVGAMRPNVIETREGP